MLQATQSTCLSKCNSPLVECTRGVHTCIHSIQTHDKLTWIMYVFILMNSSLIRRYFAWDCTLRAPASWRICGYNKYERENNMHIWPEVYIMVAWVWTPLPICIYGTIYEFMNVAKLCSLAAPSCTYHVQPEVNLNKKLRTDCPKDSTVHKHVQLQALGTMCELRTSCT